MTLHGLSLIAGATGRHSDNTFRAVDPASNAKLDPEFHEASETEIDQAVNLAASAFPTFRARSGADRAKFLEAIAAEIEGIGDLLIKRAHEETRLSLTRLAGERARTCGQLRLFASVVRDGSWVDARIDPAQPDRQPQPRPDLRRMLLPVGPVVVFGSSNFPLAFSVAGGDTASAFAAGCPVIVKAHRAHPGTAELVGRAVKRAVAACGLPGGVFSLIHGSGATAGIALVKHPETAAVGFTGSLTAGRALCEAAASRPSPIPVFAEMSSLNPLFILPGALKDRAAEIAQGLFASFTLGVGQFCTKPGLVFAVRSAESDAFAQKLSDAVRHAPCATMLTSAIRESFVASRDAITSVDGVTVLAASQPVEDIEDLGQAGRPTVATTSAKNFLEHPELAREAFGPFTLLVLADNANELSACASALEGQLTATIHGNAADLTGARPLLATLERIAGRIVVNGFPTGVEVSPAMNHGGPYPATSDGRFTSVGTAAILRFARPVCYQGLPDDLLPDALKNANPLGLLRLVDGKPTRDAV
ncbi:MAG: aldehyde dehydrogenase (NADP(+)) [Opitutaceae bacterium]|nr:aldehyde dehydrogenase (NADP(+)) [Opitutaceae bacterium]